MQSHTLGDGLLGSRSSNMPNVSKLKRLIGTCHTMEVSMGGVSVQSLIDTGSMVTTITESYFNAHFAPLRDGDLKNCEWLGLKAANGLEIPYLGYVELDVMILGTCMPGMGILVVKDPLDVQMREKKESTPGVSGMNVLNEYYYTLFAQYGPSLFQAPQVQSAAPALRQALRH